MIAFACAHCGSKLRVQVQFAGRQSKCPTCKQALQVPHPSATAAFVPPQRIDGAESSLARVGLNVDVTLGPHDTSKIGPAAGGAARNLPAGRTNGKERYVIDGEIARGGMGAVLRAIDGDIRRQVAVKYMLDATDPRKQARFIEEAQINGQLEHPNIVPVYDLGIDAQRRPFIMMKLVQGRSLKEVLDQLRDHPKQAEQEYTLGRLLNVLVNICHALAFAHARSVIHRDLKPANIMLGDFGEVYVMDWGLAKVLNGAGPAVALPAQAAAASAERTSLQSARNSKVVVSREPEADLTQEGAIVGTPMYMPPEQAAGHLGAIDQRSDIYALGAILYEMLTLEPPVAKDGGHLSVLMRVVQGEVIPPERREPRRTRAGKVPSELAAVAMKALAREKDGRYPDVESFRQDIERFQDGRSVSAKTDTAGEMIWKLVKRNKAASAASAVAGLLLLFSLVLMVRSWWQARQLAAQISQTYASYQHEQQEKDRRTREAVPAFLRAARQLAAEGMAGPAGEQVQLALLYDPSNTDAHLLRGQLLLAQKDFAGGRAVLEDYLRQRPDDADTRKAVELAATGKTTDAAVLFAIAEYLQRQKLHGLAPALLREVAPTLEAKKPLLAAYRQQVEAAWPGLGGRVTLNGDGAIQCYFYGRQEVTDLAPLRGMQINRLHLDDGPKITDLSPLQGMPLTFLSLRRNRSVRDLTPLQGMPLTWLNLGSAGPIEDLTPLQGMKLTYLDAGDCPVHDLRPLRGMPLEHLSLFGTKAGDLAPLQGMPLQLLSLTGTLIMDLRHLQGMPLTTLDLGNTQVVDLKPLQGMKLTKLGISGSRVRDLTPLRGMPLKEFSVISSFVTDLTPLQGMELREISFSPKRITQGMDALRRMKSLVKISVEYQAAYTPAEFWKRYDAGEFK